MAKYHKYGAKIRVIGITDEDADLNGKVGTLSRKHEERQFANRDPQTIFGDVGIVIPKPDGTFIYANLRKDEYEYV